MHLEFGVHHGILGRHSSNTQWASLHPLLGMLAQSISLPLLEMRLLNYYIMKIKQL